MGARFEEEDEFTPEE
jgi:hypothetical protein